LAAQMVQEVLVNGTGKLLKMSDAAPVILGGNSGVGGGKVIGGPGDHHEGYFATPPPGVHGHHHGLNNGPSGGGPSGGPGGPGGGPQGHYFNNNGLNLYPNDGPNNSNNNNNNQVKYYTI